MQSDYSPPLTRMDVVLWFLRVQLWVMVLGAIFASLSSVTFVLSPFGNGLYMLRLVGVAWAPVLVLSLFSPALAHNALGKTARDSVGSLLDCRPLVGRCVGLALLVSSVGEAALLSGLVLYGLVGGNVWQQLGGAGKYIALAQSVAPILSFFVGFFLAFGPVIRENFRAS